MIWVVIALVAAGLLVLALRTVASSDPSVAQRRGSGGVTAYLTQLHRQLGRVYALDRTLFVADYDVARVLLEDSPRGHNILRQHAGLLKSATHVRDTTTDQYKLLRDVWGNAFSSKSISIFKTLAVEYTNSLLSIWDSIPTEAIEAPLISLEDEPVLPYIPRTITLHSHISSLLVEIFSHALFNYRFNSLSMLEDAEYNHTPPKIVSSLSRLNRTIGSRLLVSAFESWRLSGDDNDKEYLKMHALNALESRMRYRKVQKLGKSAAKEAGFIVNDDSSINGGVLLDCILDSRIYIDESQKIDLEDEMREISEELVSVWLHVEKISHLVCSCIIELCLNSKLMDDVVNNPSLVDAVIRETLRIHPPITLLSRKFGHATSVLGHKVAKNQEVYINVEAINTDTKVWGDDSTVFKIDKRAGSAIAFGEGLIKCPAQSVVLDVAKIVLESMIRKYRFKLEAGQSIMKKDGYVNALDSGIKVQLFPL